MRQITKDITLSIDGEKRTFRLTKLDAFSGVELLRLLLRLEQGDGFQRSTDVEPENRPRRSAAPRSSGLTLLDLVTSLSGEELRSVMTSVFNHVEVLLPAGPHPVMTGQEWGWPELEHDAPACMRLLLEGIAWSLSGFFGESGSKPEGIPPDTSR